ncbi:MAG: hypothetical protein AAF747_05680 [Planctomycetota bacterium]
MSAKWRRNLAWDDQFFPAWAWPAKAVLRAFSSIPLAVVLLTLVGLYGALASVPIGMLVKALSWVVYIATALAMVLAFAVPVFVLTRYFDRISSAARFTFGVLGCGFAAVMAGAVWFYTIWPLLHYDPATGDGLRFFPQLVDDYAAVTIRRLPFFEMTELEFYSWWPMQVILLAFVVNMVVATVRRIEFKFVNIGVLTVHTGIVLMALGSVYYQRLKLEGDALLIANPDVTTGEQRLGPPVTTFFDNTHVAIYAAQDGDRPEQLFPIRVPRYNDYGLGVGTLYKDGDIGSWLALLERDNFESLAPISRRVPPSQTGRIDDDIELRIVGYANYAEEQTDWVRRPIPRGLEPRPLRAIEMFSDLEVDEALPESADLPVLRFGLLPTEPAFRVADGDIFAIEYTAGMSDERWEQLTRAIPERTEFALDVQIGSQQRTIVARPGVSLTVAGHELYVDDILLEPPFPIVTEGYRGATSPVAQVRVTTPDGETFTRWSYARYPEIDQDILEQDLGDGRPNRRDPDADIGITLIDASRLLVYFDELPDGSVRAAVREPGGRLNIRQGDDRLMPGERFDNFVPQLHLELADRWEHVERFERPHPVAEEEQESDDIGTHRNAWLALEVYSNHPVHGETSEIVWLPFTQYYGQDPAKLRTVPLSGGRSISLAFGRRQHPLPGFAVSLVDFEMIAYDHRGAPRDYQSIVRVEPMPTFTGRDLDFETFDHVVKLNSPLRAPFRWDPEASWLGNSIIRLASGFNPSQFKFSQAGWDPTTWEQTMVEADEGRVGEPYVQFTILGVGNNPGIHIIAFGSVLMGVGIPWAFYVKPWILKRRREKLREQRLASAKAAAAKARERAQSSAEPAGVTA